MDRDLLPGRDAAARIAVSGIALSVVATIAIGLLGPSAVVPALAGPGWQPPYSLNLSPAGHLVVAMEAAAVLLGGIGLAAALVAVRRGWAPDPRLLLLAGCLAAAVLAFLPPSGSADHLNYAAYGRMAVLGHDPYSAGAVALPGDPIADAVEKPWREEPSVYGPVATAVQALAALVGGGSVRLTVFLLATVNAAAFVATALLLHRFAGRHQEIEGQAGQGGRGRQVRAALLWTANPLVIYQLVAGMHVDTVAIVFAVAALLAGAERRRWAAGVLLGLGIAVKANAGLVAIGPAWELRRSPRRLAVVAGAATATVLVAYLLAGPQALNPVLHATKSISWATPWHLVQKGLQAAFGPGAYRVWIQIASLLVLALLATALLRALRVPYGLTGGLRGPYDDGRPPRARLAEAAGVAVAVVAAWLFATPYALPWYDGLGFALLAMVPATALDGFMVARLTVLSLAYLPARQDRQPADLSWLFTVRGVVVPALLLALTAVLAWWALTTAAGRGSTRPASTAPPP
nr:polyprenol phosphomannose-dependent alpha 1,6 mannosyltransferase MptB [Sphaerisporangium fuscum]